MNPNKNDPSAYPESRPTDGHCICRFCGAHFPTGQGCDCDGYRDMAIANGDWGWFTRGRED